MSTCSDLHERGMIDVGRTQLSGQMRGSGQSVRCITGETGRHGPMNGLARVPAGEDTVGTHDLPELSHNPLPAGHGPTSIAEQASDTATETFMPAQLWTAK